MKNIPYLHFDGERFVESRAPGFTAMWVSGKHFEFAKDSKTWAQAIHSASASYSQRTGALISFNSKRHAPFDLDKGVFFLPFDWYELSNEQQKSLLFNPMMREDMYRNFLKVDDLRPESGLRFIKRYGALGFCDLFEPKRLGHLGCEIEPWAYFQYWLKTFKELVEIWGRLKERDIAWLRDKVLEYKEEHAFSSLQESKGISDKEVQYEAYGLMRGQLDYGLRKVNPCLNHGFDDHGEFLEDEAHALSDVSDSRFLLGYHCPTLLDAIYLQFYLDVTNPNGTLKRCLHCHNYFMTGSDSVAGHGKRSDSKYCTKSCQNAAGQARFRANTSMNKKGK